MKILLLSCALLTGCITDEGPPPDPTDVADPAPNVHDPVAVPAALQLQAEDGAPSSASIADCVYIQWCNKPNSPERISCVLRPRCIDTCNTQSGRDQVVSECQNEAVAVCGTSFDITYHGCNGLGPP